MLCAALAELIFSLERTLTLMSAPARGYPRVSQEERRGKIEDSSFMRSSTL